MKVEIRKTPNGPWEPVARAGCYQLDANQYRVTLPTLAFVPMKALDGMGVRINGVEAQQVHGTDSNASGTGGGTITLDVLLPVRRFGS